MKAAPRAFQQETTDRALAGLVEEDFRDGRSKRMFAEIVHIAENMLRLRCAKDDRLNIVGLPGSKIGGDRIRFLYVLACPACFRRLRVAFQ